MTLGRQILEVRNKNVHSYSGIECDLCLTQSQRTVWLAFTYIMKDVSIGFDDLNQKIIETSSDERPTFHEECENFARKKRIEAAMAHKLSSGAKSLYPVLSPRQRTHLDLFLRTHPAFINALKL